MKKIVNFALTLFVSISSLLFLIGIIITVITRNDVLETFRSNINYYQISRPIIIETLKSKISNVELQNLVDEIITEDRIKSDVKRLSFLEESAFDEIGNDIKKDFDNSFLLYLKGKKYDNKNLDDLTTNLANVYKNSIYPYKEFKTLNKLLSMFNNKKYMLISLLFVVLSIVSSFIFSDKSMKILVRSGYLTGFVLLFPYIFFSISGLLNNFYYTNIYYTLYIKSMLDNALILLDISGVILIIISLIIAFSIRNKIYKE